MEMLERVSQFIFNEKFWFPGNATWEDLKGDENTHYPQIRDLLYLVPISVGLFILRLVWERFLALPLGRKYNIRETQRTPAIPIPALEQAFKYNRKILPNHHEIEKLADNVGWTPRQVERWWRRRRVQNKPSTMQRFQETSWRFFYYTSAFVLGTWVMLDKPWFWDTRQAWIGYPFQPISRDIWWYYMISLGFYWSLVLSLFMDHTRKDFWEMIVHHISTIMLMTFSFTNNMTRIGSLVVQIHDIVDPWLEGAKCAKYLQWHKLCDFGFIVFAILWLITRLTIYPFRILRSSTFECVEIAGVSPGWYLFNGFLLVLQVLHIIWFYMILRMAYYYILHKKVDKDDRSDTEDETNSEDEMLIVNGNVSKANGVEPKKRQ